MGVLDKAALRLGDNNTVNFERSLIFLTSNLGAREMRDRMRPGFGFESITGNASGATLAKLHHIGMGAVRRKFSPEFVNRIDTVITYQPLDAAALAEIVDLQIAALELHIENRLAERAFELEVTAAARRYLLAKGTSSEYGARELKRTILREVYAAAGGDGGEWRSPGGVDRARRPQRVVWRSRLRLIATFRLRLACDAGCSIPMATEDNSLEALYRRRLSRRWRDRLIRALQPPAPFVTNPAEPLNFPLGKWNLYIGGAGRAVEGYVNLDLFAVPGVDVAADAELLPFPCEVFTRIECDAVLEHVRDPEKVMDEIYRVLAPGGYVAPGDALLSSVPRISQRLPAIHAGWFEGTGLAHGGGGGRLAHGADCHHAGDDS